MIHTREESIQKAVSMERWDIIVIGGGATGIGTALDAASRGYSTLLLESHDFGKGTSSKSTKLIHGGVRYLRQGNVKMVMKALRERGRLLQNAPHLVHPLEFVVPCYRWWHKPWYGLGMKVYDALARRLGIGPSRLLNREETTALIPGIQTNGLIGGVSYWDGQFDDTRLLVALAQTAAAKRAVLLNYFLVTGLITSNERISGVEAYDAETGKTYTILAKAVINATGIFTDSIRQMDDKSALPMMQAAQGIHIVLDSAFLSEKTAVMVPDTDDGRVIFGVPWNGKLLFGTTDTPLPGPDREPKALDSEVDYLLEHAARYLKKAPTRSDIRSVFAGIRPLVSSNPSSTSGKPKTKSISRDHTLVVSDTGLVTITGGKWTTYRQMAEDAVNRAEKSSGMKHRVCLTRTMSIPDPLQKDVEHKNEREGVLHPNLTITRHDVHRALTHEWARSTEDILSRRTRCLLLDARAAVEVAPVVSQMLADHFKWDHIQQQADLKAFYDTSNSYQLMDHG